jgi:hypothetical protein
MQTGVRESMKEPNVNPKPTFLGHRMKWVASTRDGGSVYFGHCWKYKSSKGKLVVRAWPTEPNTNDETYTDPPEVRLEFTLKMEDDMTETMFVGRCRTHNELLRLLSRAEREVRKLFKRVELDYDVLKEIVG